MTNCPGLWALKFKLKCFGEVPKYQLFKGPRLCVCVRAHTAKSHLLPPLTHF